MRNGKLVFLMSRMSQTINEYNSIGDWSRAIKKHSSGKTTTMFFIPADAKLEGL